MKKTYESGTKPRYDGMGSLFGDMHRTLPRSICMFDIDRMFVRINSELWLRQEDTAWVEYRHRNEEIVFVALFEVKYKPTERDFDLANSANRARRALAKKIGCRLFVVIENNGKVPLDFYEIDLDTGQEQHVYSLVYDDTNCVEEVRRCWAAIGLLEDSQ